MDWNFVERKIEIFRDFWVFLLRPISKTENSEIPKIQQKRHNTVIWEYSFKNS